MKRIKFAFGEFLALLNSTDGSLTRKVLRSGSWIAIMMFVVNILAFLKTVALARFLTPEIFGLMGICFIILRGLEVFTQTGFGAALIHSQDKFEELRDTAFTLILIRGLVLSAVTFFIAPFVALFYDKEILEGIVKLASVSFILSAFYNINAIALEKELDFKRLTILNNLAAILDFLTVVVLVYYMRSVWALVIGKLLSSSIQSGLSYIIVPGQPRLKFEKKCAKELFKYGKFITGLTIAVFLTTEIDDLAVGKILGMTALGYYVLAYKLANLPTTHFTKIVSKVMFPAYSKLQNNLPALQEAYFQVLKFIAILALPAAAGMAALAPEIVGGIFGEKWLPAVRPLQILCLFGAVRAIGASNGYLYNAIGRPDVSFYMSVTNLFVIIAIIYPLTVKYELVGASLAIVIPTTLQLVIAIFILSKIIHVKVRSIAKILFSAGLNSVIMYTALILIKMFFYNIDIYGLILLIIVGSMIYGLLNLREIVFFVKHRRLLLDDL